MNRLFLLLTALCVSALVASTAGQPRSGNPGRWQTSATPKHLQAFASESELHAFLAKLAEQTRRDREAQADLAFQAASPSAAMSLGGDARALAADSVTNVQHLGVDEGGIVKLHGDHLVVLRRGRLFTIAVGNGDLRPVSMVDAFAPDINPSHTWYDELLVTRNLVVVIGFSPERGGTEIGLFDLDQSGHLRHRSTHHLRSNDYYSSRNYSSRLIGSKLIFYTPLSLSSDADNPLRALPALRRWHSGAAAGEFRRIAPASRVYRPATSAEVSTRLALHTVTVCELGGGDLDCEATVVTGPPGRVFYVSPEAVYVWTTDRGASSSRRHAASTVYRLPLDGAQPTALQVTGSPVDQFSFLESADRHLNVLVRTGGMGDGMWGAELGSGDLALLRIATDRFSDGSESAPLSSYCPLPKPAGSTFQNRFVGDYLLYGTGSGWRGQRPAENTRLHVVRWAGNASFDVSLPHGVDRIEPLGGNAVVVGSRGDDLHFSAVRLTAEPRLEGGYVRPAASQGELRSHGFFYKPTSSSDGLLGLPVSRGSRPGYRHLSENSAAVLFLDNQSLRFREIGELKARSVATVDDGCRASCVDWYGNARPLFVGGRVFALLGYELVEGGIDEGRLKEVRRASFAPKTSDLSSR